MTRVMTFAPLEFEGSCVRVRWTVEPPSPLYRRSDYTVDFGDALDPESLPLWFWWSTVLLTLHSQWNLLRPCRVVLPFQLPEEEAEFWLRLTDAERNSLEAYRDREDVARTIALVGRGAPLPRGDLPPPVERHATAFSGGKESLLQTGLLCELTERPLLVNTQSEMPPLKDHSARRRAQALQGVVTRRDCEVVVVRSDFRSAWDNFLSWKEGYRQTVNEITDAFFYAANLLAVAAARGIRHVYIGAEFENQKGGRPWRDTYVNFFFMLSPLVLRAVGTFLEERGFCFGSLLYPLSHFQDMRVLWQRYPDLAELQASCFDMQSEQDGCCQHCVKCWKSAMLLLAFEIDPARIELDVNRLFTGPDPWGTYAGATGGALYYAAQQIRPARVRRFFRSQNWKQRLGLEEPPAFRALRAKQHQYEAAHEDWVHTYRPSFAAYLPAPLGDALDRIYREYSPVVDSTDRVDECARVDAGVAWIVAPLLEKPGPKEDGVP